MSHPSGAPAVSHAHRDNACAVWLSVCLLVIFNVTVTPLPAAEPEVAPTETPSAAISYEEHIQPLLEMRCTYCHGADDQNSGLRLDTRGSMLSGGYSGPVLVPGKPEESLILKALAGSDDSPRMPPVDADDPLSADEVELIRAWIAAGAPGPEDEAPTETKRRTSDHWAFQPLGHDQVPAVSRAEWVRNPIDAFVLARLDEQKLSPATEADRVTLIRRVTLDLTGLPPTPAEVAAFLADKSPHAYEQLVTRLLDSPHYGERWGRHWLDAARYADSNGYSIDGPRSIWPYRDWVIQALNNDLPFDEFTIEQIAGDLLPDATTEQKVATGFHRNTLINQEGGVDQEEFRVEAVVDRVSTVGTVFLGLTIGCARCHDHKFDPISQQEFFQLYAFLNSCDEPNLELPTPEQAAARNTLHKQIRQVEQQKKDRAKQIEAALAEWEAALPEAAREKLTAEQQAALATSAEQRTDEHRKQLLLAAQQTDADHKKLDRELARLKKQLPEVTTTMVVRERSKPRETHIHVRGEFLRHGRAVSPGTPEVLPPLETAGDATPSRLDLARWIVDPRNPLTPRVTVNRIWQQYFGQGLVDTENDFGTQGTPPTHPELLDWLGGELIRSGWSLKQLHRLIVTSSTYRQSSTWRPDLVDVDPLNRLLARQQRLRLDAETIRDSALATSGLLSLKVGGPSVFPYQPDGVMRLAQVERPWNVSPGEDQHRRTLYTYFWRSTPHPFLKTFDAPDANTTCTRRMRSNTPLQALTLLNDPAFVECAESLAAQLTSAPGNDAARLELAFETCLSRGPSSTELARLLQLLQAEREALLLPEDAVAAATDTAISDLEVATDARQATAAVDRAAWTTVCRVLMNLDEFITRE